MWEIMLGLIVCVMLLIIALGSLLGLRRTHDEDSDQ